MSTTPKSLKHALLFVVCLFGCVGEVPSPTNAQDDQQAPSTGWTLNEALEQLRMYPNDAYLQYVALQLARREGSIGTVREEIQRRANGDQPAWRGRTEQVNLFSLFSGSLAVQESLQLETMTGGVNDPRRPRTQVEFAENADELGQTMRRSADELVSVSELAGPTIKSHPWTKMLAGRNPERSPLAQYVPEDQYYVRFQSVGKLLEMLDLNDTWGDHLHSQTSRKAYRSLVSERLMDQLALRTNELARPFYDLVVQELAITGSDLYLREGSDVTLLFRFQQPQVFRAQMEGFLLAAQNSRADAVGSEHEYRGIPYTFVGTPDRRVHAFAAYLKDDLHLRSNSEVGLQRVIDVMLDDGTGADRSHAQSDEFAYIRTLMPHGAAEEDGFIYLSDPFIRRLVGPELKLTERRRVLCYNHLRMIGHACALYETEHGHPPESIDDLAEAECCPGDFNEGHLACPCGGRYSLTEDHHAGVCSHHGRVETMIPCCEIAETSVSGTEAQMYEDFVTQYNQYWRTFFDPIAIRVTATPEKYRLETIILPLINNSIYQGMAMVLGGEPTPLDVPPIPDRNIFSLAFQLNKEQLLEQSGWQPPEPQPESEPQLVRNRVPLDSVNHFKQIALAMHNYHDTFGTFPPSGTVDDNGKPLLSWRVQLLPYLDQAQLYDQFHHDEPWDSPHNKQFISQMPPIFESLGRKEPKPGTTTYVTVVGEQTLFDGTGKGRRFADVRDGTSNTVLAIDATEDNAVIWTKPDDVRFDPKTIRKVLLGRHGEHGLVAMADGSVQKIPPTVTDDDIRRAMLRNDGEVVADFGESPQITPQRRRGFFGLSNMGLGEVNERLAYDFVTQGLGNKIGLHVYDGEPTFDFALTKFLGQAMGSFSGRNRFDSDFLPVFLLIASLNSPVYVSLPLEDTGITDQFIEELDKSLAVIAREKADTGWFRLERDFYTLPVSDTITARTVSIGFGPVKWRFFWARIGDGLYIASKPDVLQDIAKLSEGGGIGRAANGFGDSGSAAHAMVRIRPQNWNQMLPNFQLGWAESHRLACLDNVGRMSSLARLVAAGGGDVEARSAQLYGVDFFCPCGGHYAADDDHQAVCTVHGSAHHPQQGQIGDTGGSIDELLKQFTGLTLTLTFLEDGLHATLDVDRD